MAIVNISKPTTSITNTTKASIGETYGTISTSWASETRTWLAASQLFSNVTRQTSSITNTVKPA